MPAKQLKNNLAQITDSLPAGKAQHSGTRLLIILCTVLILGASQCSLFSPAPDPVLSMEAGSDPGSECGHCAMVWSDPDPFIYPSLNP